MNFKTWAPLWSGIVDSSIWDESDNVVKVFLTMLALKDADHTVRLNAYQIGKRSRKTEREVLDALQVLSSPDTRREEAQPFEGRRIEAVEEGWLILNGEKYRAMVQLEMKRAKNRRGQATFRAKKKLKFVPSVREQMADKAFREGNDELGKRILEDGLPNEESNEMVDTEPAQETSGEQ